MRRLLTAGLLGVSLLGVQGLAAPDAADSFDELGTPAYTTFYSYDTLFTVGTSFKNRTSAAASEWSARAEGGLTYSSSSSNKIGYRSQIGIASASAPCGTGGSCVLWFDLGLETCDEFYYGTGSSAGTSNPSVPGCVPGKPRVDAWGVLVHEFGHWRGLGHHLHGYCGSGSAKYAPQPTKEIASMCYSTSKPSTEGGSGSAGIVPRRSVSQDEIQGVRDILVGDFVANHHFTECSGCDWEDVPRFWMVTPSSNHWWGGSIISLNNNSTVPYPEVKQRVRGNDADYDNDGRFRATARVQAKDNAIYPRAVVFVRHVHGSTTDHEKKCDSGGLTVGVWTTVTCDLHLVNSSIIEFEFGVRVTEKVDIDWITIEDL